MHAKIAPSMFLPWRRRAGDQSDLGLIYPRDQVQGTRSRQGVTSDRLQPAPLLYPDPIEGYYGQPICSLLLPSAAMALVA